MSELLYHVDNFFFIYESGCYNFTSWQVLGPGSASGSILMQGPGQPWTKQSMLQVMKYINSRICLVNASLNLLALLYPSVAGLFILNWPLQKIP